MTRLGEGGGSVVIYGVGSDNIQRLGAGATAQPSALQIISCTAVRVGIALGIRTYPDIDLLILVFIALS